MRLLNTMTITLCEFFSVETTAYAILSHRWDDDEVTFQDLIDGKGPEKRGWEKIEGCCAKALEDGWEYLWIDSCCIDKASSAELSESINSMFAWYKNAHVCYAYLSDVPSDLCDLKPSDQIDLYSALERSRWFTRGWTLQELLAPEWVVFLANDWTEIGTKASLATVITSITGITHLFNFQEASVAQKMSWAAHRETTRLEDQAYCMMGLFDVNMPLLYGEGSKAFIRLQLEILSKSDDESIFAWSGPPSGLAPRPGLLTDTPQGFKNCGGIKRADFDSNRPPHFMTSKGLQMNLLIQQILLSEDKVPSYLQLITGDIYFAPLNCTLEDKDGIANFVVLYLIDDGRSFIRYGDPDLATDEWYSESNIIGNTTRALCHVKQSGHNDSMTEVSLRDNFSYIISIDVQAIYAAGYYISDRIIWPERPSAWNFWRGDLSGTTPLTVTMTSLGYFVLLRCESPSGPTFTVVLGYSSQRPWIGALTMEHISLRDLAVSFDKQDRWPRSQNDPRTFQDRDWVQIGSMRYIDMILHKTGVSRPSDAEKYWVEMRIREQLEEAQETDDSVNPQKQGDDHAVPESSSASEIVSNAIPRRSLQEGDE